MTKPKGGSRIGNQHFNFLTTTPRKGRLSLSTTEAKRFVAMGKKIVMCANWNKQIDQDIFNKVISIIEIASNNADTSCDALPFSLPKEVSEDFDFEPIQAPPI